MKNSGYSLSALATISHRLTSESGNPAGGNVENTWDVLLAFHAEQFAYSIDHRRLFFSCNPPNRRYSETKAKGLKFDRVDLSTGLRCMKAASRARPGQVKRTIKPENGNMSTFRLTQPMTTEMVVVVSKASRGSGTIISQT